MYMRGIGRAYAKKGARFLKMTNVLHAPLCSLENSNGRFDFI